MGDMKYIEKGYQERWKEIIEVDGVVNMQQVKIELYEYAFLLDEVPKVYMHVSGGKISYPNTFASEVISEADAQIEKLCNECDYQKAYYEKGKVLITCVYCGHEYPNETPTHGADVLKEHIKICEKHPMRESEKKVALLRKVLLALVGVESEDELLQMEIYTRESILVPECDRISILNAIQALLETTS